MNKLNDELFGPVQRQWLENLERYPDRQCKGRLGDMTENGYEACCLGELLLTDVRMKGGSIMEIIQDGDSFYDEDGDSEVLANSFVDFGLHGSGGEFRDGAQLINDGSFDSLADMNDKGFTWPEIAQWVRENPEQVFERKV